MQHIFYLISKFTIAYYGNTVRNQKKNLFKNFDYYSKNTNKSEIFSKITNISDFLVFLLNISDLLVFLL